MRVPGVALAAAPQAGDGAEDMCWHFSLFLFASGNMSGRCYGSVRVVVGFLGVGREGGREGGNFGGNGWICWVDYVGSLWRGKVRREVRLSMFRIWEDGAWRFS